DLENPVWLNAITEPHLFSKGSQRLPAARQARTELAGDLPNSLLCLGVQGISKLDRDEETAWCDWGGARLAPKFVLGEGFMAAAAWQCGAAVELIRQRRYDTANVSVLGSNQQAIAARFAGRKTPTGKNPNL